MATLNRLLAGQEDGKEGAPPALPHKGKSNLVPAGMAMAYSEQWKYWVLTSTSPQKVLARMILKATAATKKAKTSTIVRMNHQNTCMSGRCSQNSLLLSYVTFAGQTTSGHTRLPSSSSDSTAHGLTEADPEGEDTLQRPERSRSRGKLRGLEAVQCA